MGPDGPKWGQEDFFPTNPDLADILGDTDFDFENFYFWDFFVPNFPRFPNSRAGPHPFCCNISSATGKETSETNGFFVVSLMILCQAIGVFAVGSGSEMILGHMAFICLNMTYF